MQYFCLQIHTLHAYINLNLVLIACMQIDRLIDYYPFESDLLDGFLQLPLFDLQIFDMLFQILSWNKAVCKRLTQIFSTISRMMIIITTYMHHSFKLKSKLHTDTEIDRQTWWSFGSYCSSAEVLMFPFCIPKYHQSSGKLELGKIKQLQK